MPPPPPHALAQNCVGERASSLSGDHPAAAITTIHPSAKPPPMHPPHIIVQQAKKQIQAKNAGSGGAVRAGLRGLRAGQGGDGAVSRVVDWCVRWGKGGAARAAVGRAQQGGRTIVINHGDAQLTTGSAESNLITHTHTTHHPNATDHTTLPNPTHARCMICT